MPTSGITHTILDPSGDPVVGVPVVARLSPPGGFRKDVPSEILTPDSTVSDEDGSWRLDLEQQANISPDGSYWEIEERLAGEDGGSRRWTVGVGEFDATLPAALIVSAPEELAG